MQFLRKILFFLFGSLNWQLPPWLQLIKNGITHAFNWMRTHKKILASAITILLIAYGGLLWYDNLPKPVRLEISGTAPALTPITEKPVYDSVYINFSGSAAPLEKVGKPVEKGVSITPAIKGSWQWLSDKQLRFKPEQDWGVGTDYVVKFEKTLFPSHVLLREYEYRFSSAQFSAWLENARFYQDPQDSSIKRVVATVKFTHPVDKVSLEKNIELVMLDKKAGILSDGKPLKFTLSYNKFESEAYISSEPVSIPLKDEVVKIRVKEGIHAARGGNETEAELLANVTIPGMYNYFRVSNVQPSLVRNKENEPEQVLIVQLTAGVKEEDLRKNIAVYELPRDLPALQGRRGRRNHWWRVDDVGPQVLAMSRRVALTPIATEKEFSQMHSFHYRAKPGRTLFVQLKQGTRSFGGYVLAKAYEGVVRVPPFPRELNIMHEGAILGMRGERKLSIVARGVEAIQYEIGRVLPGQINHLVTQSNGDMKSPYFNNYNFNAENITERFTTVEQLQNLPPEKAQYTSFDFSPYLKNRQGKSKRGFFFFKVQRWMNDRYATSPEDSRFILITDLGLLVKDNSDRSHDVFVQSLSTGTPVAGAQVSLLGKNGIAIFSGKTDSRGHISVPDVTDFRREKQPVVYLVKKGDDISFIPFNKGNRSINYSRFDIGGVYSSGQKDSLSSYLFSDRGIYRPGDKFNIGIVTRAMDWERSLAGLPVEVIVTDARGLTVKKQKIRLDETGFNEINYQTALTSPTGTYQVRTYLIKDKYRRNLLGSTTVKVEEFIPDRMKIQARFSEERLSGWVSPKDLKGRVSLQNLYGIPAGNRRVSAMIRLQPAQPYFRKYRDYRFFDPMRAKHSFNEQLSDTKTNEKGEAEFDIDLSRFAPATYRLTLMTQGYEAEGGRSVSAQRSLLVSPLDYLVGYKADGKLGYIKKGDVRNITFIALDKETKTRKVDNLQFELVEQRYVSVLAKQSDGTFKYQSVKKKIPLSRKEMNIAAKGLKYKLPTDKAGDFILRVLDSKDTELSQVGFTVVGTGDLTRSLDRNAELQIKLNKKDFNPGEEIELQIKAPYTGAGLITIERDKVYSFKWFRTDSNTTLQRIQVPYELEGNAYVNVSFIRAPDSREIYMSPLSYGVMPFTINQDARVTKIDLEVPDISQPGEKMKITYQASRPGKIVVFAVNEGILQVANYQTPNPLAHFYKKRALEVNTLQILDLLLPEYDVIRALSASGGGMMEKMARARGKNLNPFQRKQKKPVVFWSGIIDTDGSKGELEYTVPDHFNGKLRVMAVAIAKQAVGVSSRSALVRGNFIISPNVPTFAAPGDEFTVSVNVANNIEGSGKDASIDIALETTAHLKVLGKAKQQLLISEAREKSTRFRIRANDILGSGGFIFTASHGDKKTRYRVDLSVRPPAAFMTEVQSGYLQDENIEIPVKRRLYPHFRELKVAASPVPLSMAHGLKMYLDNYPYLCTEQLVSRAFPAIVLRERPEFAVGEVKAEQSLERIIHVLRARQNAQGAFGFWSANSHVSNMQTVYATHFLTEAKQRGYSIPADLLKAALGYLQQVAKQPVNNLHEARESAYAIYVLTRNGQVTTRLLARLRKQLAREMKQQDWQPDMTGIYIAASYSILKLDKDARRLIKQSRLGEVQKADYRYFYDGLLRNAHLLYVLSLHFRDRLPEISAEQLQKLVEPIQQGRFNTLSAASLILALDTYANATGTAKDMQVKIVEILAEKQRRQLAMPEGLFPQLDFSEQAKAIRIESPDRNNLFYQVIEAGFDRALPQSTIKDKLEVQREYRNAEDKVVTEARLGEELTVHIKIRSLDNKYHANIAVVDLLPGGFEVILEDRPAIQGSVWTPDYVDRREDRVLVFGGIDSDVKEYVYRIKATNVGTYKVPAVFAESMYNKSIRARGLGGNIRIVKP